MASPYYYGYSFQAPRSTYSTAPHGQRLPGSAYIYHPLQMDHASLSAYPPPPALQHTRHQAFPSSTGNICFSPFFVFLFDVFLIYFFFLGNIIYIVDVAHLHINFVPYALIFTLIARHMMQNIEKIYIRNNIALL